MKDLKIIPIPDARLVPRYLLEQIKGREWDIESWYQFQVDQMGSDSNLVLGLVNESHHIVGFIWLTIDGFSKWVYINTVSVDPAYQRKSKLINFVAGYIKKLARKLEVRSVLWTTRCPKAMQRYGYRPSTHTLMEYEVDHGKKRPKKDSDTNTGSAGRSSSATSRLSTGVPAGA